MRTAGMPTQTLLLGAAFVDEVEIRLAKALNFHYFHQVFPPTMADRKPYQNQLKYPARNRITSPMPEKFVKLASLSHLAIGRLLRVEHQGRELCLAYVDGEVYAVDDTCSHEAASLAKGSLHGDCVKCPLHGSRFDLKTGAALDEPAEDPINTYAVKIDDDDILVAIREEPEHD